MSDPPQLLRPEVRDHLVRRVRERIGLSLEGTRLPAFEAAIDRVCREADCTPDELVEQLDAGRPIWTAVVQAVTVGESYFFRDPNHFEPFADHLRAHGRARVWSAGCAAGEEPFSLAITALECLGEAACEHVKIWASDINPSFLARAAEGRYRDWALRGVDSGIRQAYFHRDGAELVLDARVRRMVHFFPANLLARAPAWPGDLDFIYCRNVLIYFTALGAAHVLHELASCLVPRGRLVLGPSDPYPQLPTMTPVREHGFTSWIAAPRPAAAHVQEPSASRDHDVRPAPTPSPPRAPPPRPRARPVPHPPAQPRLWERAQALADRGRLDEAGELAEQAIADDPLDPAAYLVRAVVHQHRNHHAAALSDARRALLLDRSIGWAHVVRATSEVALGRNAAAHRSLRRARVLLHRLPEGAPVPLSGSMHRAEVLGLCRSLEAAATEDGS